MSPTPTTNTVPVGVTVEGHIGLIEVQSPPANYFDLEVLRRIAEVGDELATNGARAIVLASQGKHFCAGLNFGADGGLDERARHAREVYTAAAQIFRIPVPVVAAVQGAAVGGGLGLACAADFRVAAPSSRFHANFASLGFHQGFGLSVSLPRIVGDQVASHMLLTAERVTGEQARSTGLADVLVADGDDANASVRAGAVELAQTIAGRAPLAVRSIRRTLREGLADAVTEILEHEIAEQIALWKTEDCAEGIAANLERRTAQFSAR
ncbi:enoyl-CoA hydratase/isomerase family protein [Janibacter alittae]|uniref:Enoyl-CoA hydratase/isomerase family protein n=1 Tax=Janibacter alittae TaxID=3115209 RepID=A0ABZ2MG33_9MICO